MQTVLKWLYQEHIGDFNGNVFVTLSVMYWELILTLKYRKVKEK